MVNAKFGVLASDTDSELFLDLVHPTIAKKLPILCTYTFKDFYFIYYNYIFSKLKLQACT